MLLFFLFSFETEQIDATLFSYTNFILNSQILIYVLIPDNKILDPSNVLINQKLIFIVYDSIDALPKKINKSIDNLLQPSSLKPSTTSLHQTNIVKKRKMKQKLIICIRSDTHFLVKNVK